MQDVRGDLAQAETPRGPVSAVQEGGEFAPVRASKAAASGEGAPPVHSGARRPDFADAWSVVDEILTPLDWDEGFRCAVIGDSGTGKTHLSRVVVAAYLDRCDGLAVVADTDDSNDYPGEARATVLSLRRSPLSEDCRCVVITGNGYDDQPADAEACAQLVKDLGRQTVPGTNRRLPALLVVDELTQRACREGQWQKGVVVIPWLAREGRRYGRSLLLQTQSPQDCARAAIEQAQIVCAFRLAGLGARCLWDRGYLDKESEAALLALPGPESDPGERGGFLCLRRGRPWDGKVYRLG